MPENLQKKVLQPLEVFANAQYDVGFYKFSSAEQKTNKKLSINCVHTYIYICDSVKAFYSAIRYAHS